MFWISWAHTVLIQSQKFPNSITETSDVGLGLGYNTSRNYLCHNLTIEVSRILILTFNIVIASIIHIELECKRNIVDLIVSLIAIIGFIESLAKLSEIVFRD